MSEDPKNDVKKPGAGLSWLQGWILASVLIFTIFLMLIIWLPGGPQNVSQWLKALFLFVIWSAIAAAVLVGIWAFLRWLGLRKIIFSVVCLVTLVALLYAEEDWRAKHDWDRFQHEWEAKGESFDKQSIIPAAVPDDQNFAMSPVWIAEIKFDFLNEPKRAEAWYGDKIYDENVSNLLKLAPFSEDGLTGTNEWESYQDEPDSLGDWQRGTLSDLKLWQKFYRRVAEKYPAQDIPTAPQPQSPATDVLLALSKYDPLIEQLRQDSQRPESRFPIQYDQEDPMAILLPHLAALKRSSRALQLRAIAELQAGQTDKAFDDVKLMFRLIDAIRTEPILISQLVRIAMLQITIQPIYEGLAAHQWSDAQLAGLDAELAQLNFPADYRLTMRGEMIGFEIGTFDFLRHHPEAISDISSGMSNATGDNSPALPGPLLAHVIPDSYFYQNELNCVHAVEKYYLPIADVQQGIISPSAAHRAEEAVKAETAHSSFYNVMEQMLVGPLVNSSLRFAHGQSSADLALVGVALERYHLTHGNYPASLDDLAPQYLQEIPHDVINGQPLHYRITSDGQFVLYSVGWNETDDGGEIALAKGSTPSVDVKRGDWVWKYPAK